MTSRPISSSGQRSFRQAERVQVREASSVRDGRRAATLDLASSQGAVSSVHDGRDGAAFDSAPSVDRAVSSGRGGHRAATVDPTSAGDRPSEHSRSCSVLERARIQARYVRGSGDVANADQIERRSYSALDRARMRARTRRGDTDDAMADCATHVGGERCSHRPQQARSKSSNADAKTVPTGGSFPDSNTTVSFFTLGSTESDDHTTWRSEGNSDGVPGSFQEHRPKVLGSGSFVSLSPHSTPMHAANSSSSGIVAVGTSASPQVGAPQRVASSCSATAAAARWCRGSSSDSGTLEAAEAVAIAVVGTASCRCYCCEGADVQISAAEARGLPAGGDVLHLSVGHPLHARQHQPQVHQISR
mmetsp:Transcript_60845/g.153804  ORF Transcript_60845/g.153804 Transcript_60845/m.153804 type:complete len:360 (-) Transcript_60845:25-1104(-)